MASVYPGALDTLSTSKGDATLMAADHPAHHNDLADAVNKIEPKVGTGASTPVANSVLAGTGAGVSAWTAAPALDGLTVDATTLAVDAANNRVGIGTAAPTDKLHIVGGNQVGVAMNGESAIFAEWLVQNGAATVAGYSPFSFLQTITKTDGAATDPVAGLGVTSVMGAGGVAAIGSIIGLNSVMFVRGAGSASNEYGTLYGAQMVEIGTGFAQTAGPAGKSWFTDYSLHGPIAVQPVLLNGVTMFVNNHYNGPPSQGTSAAFLAVTAPGGGGSRSATHGAATTYSVGAGVHIAGIASAAAAGFTSALKIGGTSGPWQTATRVTNAIEIADYDTYGIHITGKYAGSTPSAAIAVASGAGKILSGRVTDGGFVGTAIFQAATDAENGLMVMQKSGTQSANIFQVTNSAGTELIGVSPVGHLRMIGVNVILTTSPGTMFGTAAAQKLGLWGATPIIQPSGTGETVGFVAGGGTTVTDASTFTGNVGTKAYRISDIVKALKNSGVMAAS